MRRFIFQKMLRFCGLTIGDTKIKLPQEKKKNNSRTFRILYYTEFLILELKSRRNSFITNLLDKYLWRKNFGRTNFSLKRVTKIKKLCHFSLTNLVTFPRRIKFKMTFYKVICFLILTFHQEKQIRWRTVFAGGSFCPG